MITILNPEKYHLPEVAQLTSDIFANGQYLDQFRDNYIDNSHYDWQVSRIGLDGNKIIHHWGVWGYPMWVESIQLKVAGIGAVATHPDYRKQGWMHQAAQSSIDGMAAAGYDLSILHGRHYAKMGYARAWNTITYRVKIEELPPPVPCQPYQPLPSEKSALMDALYNQTHVYCTGAAIRPTFRKRDPQDMGVYAWVGKSGQLEGYVRVLPAEGDPHTLMCLEAAGDPDQALAVLRELYQQGGYEKLGFFSLPHHHPLLQRLRQGTCIVENLYADLGGWRVRIVNLHSTLQKLVPLLQRRLAQSQFAAWQGDLLLDAGEQQVTVQIQGGAVKIQPGAGSRESAHTLQGGAAVARFLIGSDEPDEIIRQAGMTGTGLASPLVRVLFPNLHPVMSQWDEY